jgi:hypothetical protein
MARKTLLAGGQDVPDDRLASAMAPPRETAFSLPCPWRTEFLRGPHVGIAIERQSVC